MSAERPNRGRKQSVAKGKLEAQRIAELDSYRIIGSEIDKRFDRITKLASRILDVPIALISFFHHDNRQWLKSAYGTDFSHKIKTISFCSRTIECSDFFEVNDATKDTRFAENPLVTRPPHIRFYGGVPLITARGYRLGTLSVLDTKPRTFSTTEREALDDLSKIVMDELELHRCNIEAHNLQQDDDLKSIQLRRILDCVAYYIAILRPDGRVVESNIESMRHAHLMPEDVIGKQIWNCFWWSHEASVKRRLKHIAERARLGRPQRLDLVMRISSDHYLTTDFTLTPLLNANGEVQFLIASANDISYRKTIENKLRQSEARFRGTFENAAVGMALVSLEGKWLSVNQRLLTILGYSEKEMLSKTLPEIAHPSDLAEHLKQFGRLKEGKIERYAREKRYIRKDGSAIWVNVTVSLQRSDSDDPLYGIMVIEDIEARKEHEDRQQLLVGELSHRTKNMMSMMQAIANNSLRFTKDPTAFVETFRTRLQAMAAAHDLLTQENWQRASLRELIETQLYIEIERNKNRIELNGFDLLLSGQVAINLALILHELASNAVKHGALSKETGHLRVSWELTQKNNKPNLFIEWVEENGPSTATPKNLGFGLQLIERSLKRGLGAEVKFDWQHSGLVAKIELPLTFNRENQLFRV